MQQQHQLQGPWQSLGCREQPSPSAALLVLSGCPVCTHTENKSQPCMKPFAPCSGSFPGSKGEAKASSSFTQGQTSSPSGDHAPGARSPPSMHSCSRVRQLPDKTNLKPLQTTLEQAQGQLCLPPAEQAPFKPFHPALLAETTDRVNCAEEASKSIPRPQLFPGTAKRGLQRPRAA